MLGAADRASGAAGGIEAAAGSRTIEAEDDGPHAQASMLTDPGRSVTPLRLVRRGRAGRAPQSAEPGAGSAGPAPRSGAA